MSSATFSTDQTCLQWRQRQRAAMRILLVLWVATPSLVKAVFIGSDVVLHKDEVIMMCPLTANVKDTRDGIIVKYFHDPPDPIPDDVFECYQDKGDEPECFSRYNFTLKGQLTDMVMVKVPESSLRYNGTYKVQLLPPDYSNPFTLCGFFRVSDTDKEENVAVTDTPFAVTDTPVVSSTAAKRSTPSHEPVERETSHSWEWDRAVKEMITAILILLILLILLVVLILSMVILYFLHQRKALEPMKRGVTCSRLDDLHTSLAVLFWTLCSFARRCSL